jgi:hypothetical protein
MQVLLKLENMIKYSHKIHAILGTNTIGANMGRKVLEGAVGGE